MAKKILVIEDDAEFLEAVSATLSAKGYEVATACDGKEGMQKVTDVVPDLILLDVMLRTKTEGFDVVRHLKKNPATENIPVILITGIRRELNLPFGFEADEQWLPVRAILEKPVKPQVLLENIEKILS